MRKKLAIFVMLVFLVACSNKETSQLGNTSEYKITLLLHENTNSNLEWSRDTLIKDSLISLATTSMDLYFTNRIAHIPYYLPTNGIFRDSIKEKECNWEIYPDYVKCYEYDTMARVVKMSVNGSGSSLSPWTYRYDSLNRIVEIKHSFSTYNAQYKDESYLLSKLTVDQGPFQKRIEIKYSIID